MNLLMNLRYGARTLRKSPGLVAMAAISLGLGIGINTAVFSLVRAVLFRTPAIEQPNELVNIYSRRIDSQGFSTSSIADWADLRARATTLDELVGHSWAMINVEIDRQPRLEIGSIVTDGYFEMLGVNAAIGRRFLAEEQVRGAPPVVLLTDRFWRRVLAGRDDIVGEALRLGGVDFEIVGILPPGFNGLLRGIEAELFVPAVQVELVEPAGEIGTQGPRGDLDRYDWRGYRFLTLTGRRAQGATAAQVEAEITTLVANLASEHPLSNERLTATVVPTSNVRINPSVDGTVVPAAGLVLALVGLVLLVASANLANLLLARAVGRRQEIGVRLALGASKRQLLSQLVVESMMLALVGMLSGIAVAAVAVRLLASGRLDLPVSPAWNVGLEWPVLLFALGLALITGIICGLAPAVQAFRVNLIPALKAEAGSGAARSGPWWRPSFGSLLVVGQVAMSLILVIGASLLTRSVGAARNVDLGFDAESVGALTLDLDTLDLERQEAGERLNQLVRRIETLPGIDDAGITTRMPLGLNMVNSSFFIEGIRESEDDPPLNLEVTRVDRGYFDSLGLEPVAGRLFDPRDREDSPPVAVVTQEMGRRFWPDESSIGKTFRIGEADSEPYEIVGVVPDYKVITPGETTRPFVHFAWQQRPSEYGILVYGSRGSASTLLESAYREIQSAEPEAFIVDSTTLDAMRDIMILPVRAGGALFTSLSALALLLSSIGLAGLIAYRVGRSGREIGLRMALGAERASIVRRVLLQSLRLVGVGSALGLVGAMVLGRLLQSVLYVPAWDPSSILRGVLALVLVAGVASILPAARAVGVDPLVVLRQS